MTGFRTLQLCPSREIIRLNDADSLEGRLQSSQRVVEEASTRAGFPTTVAPAGTSRVTTAPAPIIADSPMRTPPSTITPDPSAAPRATYVRCIVHCPSVTT